MPYRIPDHNILGGFYIANRLTDEPRFIRRSPAFEKVHQQNSGISLSFIVVCSSFLILPKQKEDTRLGVFLFFDICFSIPIVTY
ncbi:hypothetical protein [Massiliimalia massiliensis]|uniref:hypothetical protein n=1 Tax=Massiliimalia massiliensis TaxID=1852384 RepID=UPI00117A6F97|nr:hypothetical protein [Massiliimalia massiliensis]